ncbi:DNA methylase [Limosilactobacillus mucosae LM1]|uniref:DNA methylase n=1 Tax=Limosilactobacillus mucosae LM1 TaxID=1130798 RepID=A0A0D4CLI8_LIMMU|nr:site-specific DNA-methyltransferase [Limosilactobacillus mucosae]AJT50790.1 DNA methylase [Limosilactobacillus mucosae LM1]
METDNQRFNAAVQPNSAFLAELKEKLPEFFTREGSFDLEKFQATLKEKNIAELSEGYQLNFIGKDYARRQAGEMPNTVIVPDEEQNTGEGKDSQNLFFTGDNLEVLRHLQNSYQNKVDVIYIDPPYNTGSDDFAYPDNFEYSDDKLKEMFGMNDDQVARLKSIQGKSSHSAWLTFMYPRLALAKKLLSNNGVIFVSIDDNEQSNLKELMDEIFGEDGMAATIHCQLSTTQGMKVRAAQLGNIVKNAEYILCYTKNGRKNVATTPLYDHRPNYDEHYSLYLEEDGTICQLRDKYDFSYPKDMNNKKPLSLKEAYKKSEDFQLFVRSHLADIVRSDKIGTFSEFDNIKNGEWKKVNHSNRQYLLTRDNKGKMKQLLRLKDSWGTADDYQNSQGLRKIRGDWWDGFYIDMGNVSKEGGGIKFSNGKKPVRLIKQLIKMSSNKNSLIMDFFAGSATTAEAVMQQNLEDGGHRKFIMVQLPEKTYHTNSDGTEIPTKGGKAAYEAGFRSIDEISRERIRRAAAKIKADNELTLPADFDGSFKHYRVVKPNRIALERIEEFTPDTDELVLDTVTAFSSDALGVAGNASGEQTVLATWLAKDGYAFDADIQKIDLAGYQGNLVENNRLYLIREGWSSESTQKLLNLLGTHELNVQAVVIFGYSFNLDNLRELENGLKQLDGNVSLIKRY